ncbi:hypothetical protein V8F06_008257 [Rhypophila decipiens]
MPPKKRLHDDDDDGDDLNFKWNRHKKTKPGPETGDSPPVVAPPTRTLPPRTPTPELPGPRKGTPKDSPLTRPPGSTPANVKKRQHREEWEEDNLQREELARLESEEGERLVQDCIEELKAELLAAGVTPSEEKDKKDQKVLISVGHLGGLIRDNEDLRKRINHQQKIAKPLMLTKAQKAYMKDNLRELKVMAEAQEERLAKEGRTYVFPSLMSQSNTRALPEEDAVQMFQDLVVQVRNIVWEHMDPELVRDGIGPAQVGADPSTGTSLPGLEFCVRDWKPYVESDKQPELMFVLLEAYIWYRLQRYIFNSPTGDWNSRPLRSDMEGGPLPGPDVPTTWGVGFGPALFAYFGEAKSIIKKEFPAMLAQLHLLRAKLASYLYRMHAEPEWVVQVKAINDVLGKQLVRFVKEDNVTRYLNEALEIVHSAMDLDVRMRRSLADWEMRPSPEARRKIAANRPKIAYRPWDFLHSDMEVAGAPPPPRKEIKHISLIVSPGLLRAGTEEGEGYNHTDVVVKSRVVIDPKDFQKEYVETVPEGEGSK